MEGFFGHDFSSVRIHEGPQAASLGAIAYTQGTDIHFSPGQFRPGNGAGRELLGHELTHVVQQRAGRVPIPQGKGAPINADPALEAEADHLGKQAGNALRDARAARMAPGGRCGRARPAAGRSQPAGTPARLAGAALARAPIAAQAAAGAAGRAAAQRREARQPAIQRACGHQACADPGCHDRSNHPPAREDTMPTVDPLAAPPHAAAANQARFDLPSKGRFR